MEPRYQRISAETIPEITVGGARVRVIAGELAGVKGPGDTLMPAFLWHAAISPGEAFQAALPAGEEAAAYVIEGEAAMGESVVAEGQLAVWDRGEKQLRIANRGTHLLQVMILGGAPAEGPLVFHGPFVMNTVEQVRAAEIAYRTGRMGELA
jgi:redox-sensitive bicupin YhaK (pirin superfamily)